MPVTSCPIATVRAPIAVVWGMLNKHRIAIDVRLPLGIVNHEVVTCRSVSPGEIRVGCN